MAAAGHARAGLCNRRLAGRRDLSWDRGTGHQESESGRRNLASTGAGTRDETVIKPAPCVFPAIVCAALCPSPTAARTMRDIATVTAPAAVEIIAAVKGVHREWTQAQILRQPEAIGLESWRDLPEEERLALDRKAQDHWWPLKLEIAPDCSPGRNGSLSWFSRRFTPTLSFYNIAGDALGPHGAEIDTAQGGRGTRGVGGVDSGLAPPLWTGRSGQCADGAAPRHRGLAGAQPRRLGPPATAAPAGPTADRRLACGPRHGLGRGPISPMAPVGFLTASRPGRRSSRASYARSRQCRPMVTTISYGINRRPGSGARTARTGAVGGYREWPHKPGDRSTVDLLPSWHPDPGRWPLPGVLMVSVRGQRRPASRGGRLHDGGPCGRKGNGVPARTGAHV